MNKKKSEEQEKKEDLIVRIIAGVIILCSVIGFSYIYRDKIGEIAIEIVNKMPKIKFTYNTRGKIN